MKYFSIEAEAVKLKHEEDGRAIEGTKQDFPEDGNLAARSLEMIHPKPQCVLGSLVRYRS
jgi:hypothetical protein